jgi:3-oxoacyl-[acyl-carrier-protein] synthase II
MGICNALAAGLRPFWRALVEGRNGVGPIRHFDASQYRCQVAAEVLQFHGQGTASLDSFQAAEAGLDPSRIRRGTALFLACAREAFEDSGLGNSGFTPGLAGVAAGHSVAFTDHEASAAYYQCRRQDGKNVDLAKVAREWSHPAYYFPRRFGDMPAVLTAKVLGMTGPAITIDTACAASGHAIGEGLRLIQEGKALAMVCGGATAAVSPIGVLYFGVLGALSPNRDPETASRPFDRNRDGFVMGEGGGAVVLEEYEHARARGARIYAELKGFGSNITGLNLTDPSPDGSAEAAAMRLALEEARVRPEEVDYIAAHGTSTPKNDLSETRAIRAVFGTHTARVAVSSNKAQLGHTLTGAAVTNLVCGVMAMVTGTVPPTMHLQAPDPELDLDYVPGKAREAQVSCVMANAFAFGGQNTVLIARAL